MCRELLARNAKFVSVAPLRGGVRGGARALLGGGGGGGDQACQESVSTINVYPKNDIIKFRVIIIYNDIRTSLCIA